MAQWKPKDTPVQVYMQRETWEQVKDVARPAGFRSASEFVRHAIDDKLGEMAQEGVGAM